MTDKLSRKLPIFCNKACALWPWTWPILSQSFSICFTSRRSIFVKFELFFLSHDPFCVELYVARWFWLLDFLTHCQLRRGNREYVYQLWTSYKLPFLHVHLLSLVWLGLPVSIVFILYMICHRRPALMGVYPPWQPVNISFCCCCHCCKLDK